MAAGAAPRPPAVVSSSFRSRDSGVNCFLPHRTGAQHAEGIFIPTAWSIFPANVMSRPGDKEQLLLMHGRSIGAPERSDECHAVQAWHRARAQWHTAS